MIHPREFEAQYVKPAIELFRTNNTVSHLAVHAVAQVDILAEVVAISTMSQGRAKITLTEAKNFRDALGKRHPILSIIHDVHDCHKHGALTNSERLVSKGQRPELVTKSAYFLNSWILGRPRTVYKRMMLGLNDGKELTVHQLLSDAMEAWEQELRDLGL